MSDSLLRDSRKFIFDYFLDEAHAPVLEELMQRFKLNRVECHSLLKQLEAARHVVLVPGTQRILMANPFSSLTTPFRVSMGGLTYFGACAWDAVAFQVMLGRRMYVDSFCHHCGEKIQILFNHGKAESVEPKDPLVFISLPAAKWWDNIVNTCSNNMVFVSSKAHLDEWLKANPGLGGEALTIAQTLELSVPIYKDKMKLDYTRPSKEQLVAHWESMGLRGDFWKL